MSEKSRSQLLPELGPLLQTPSIGTGGRYRARTRLGATWVLLAAACSGCGGLASDGKTYSDTCGLYVTDEPLKVLTWWETEHCDAQVGGEACAAQALKQGQEDCLGHSGGVAFLEQKRDPMIEGLMNSQGESRAADAVIVNAGSDVHRLANCANQPGQSPAILSLGSAAGTIVPSIRDRIPEALMPLVSCPDGRIFASVLGLHRLNVLFFDQKVLAEPEIAEALVGLSETEPATQRFLTELELVAERHPKPLVIQDDPGSWSTFLFENVMAALGQEANQYEGNNYVTFWSRLPTRDSQSLAFIRGNNDRAEDNPRTQTTGALEGRGVADLVPERRPSLNMTLIEKTLEYAEALAPYIRYTDGNSVDLLVRDSEDTPASAPVYAVTGDWASRHGSQRIGQRAFPGLDEVFVYTADVLALVNKGDGPLAIDDPRIGLLHATTSAPVQDVYRRYKGSLSVVHSSGGHSTAKSADELFAEGGQQAHGIRGLPGYVPKDAFVALAKRVQSYMHCIIDRSDSEQLESCREASQALKQYIYAEYCTVISGSPIGCFPITRESLTKRDGRGH